MDDKDFMGSFENITDLDATTTMGENIDRPLSENQNLHDANDAECSPPNESDIEEFSSSLQPKFLMKNQWLISKFPLKSKEFSMMSPVLREVYGHSVRLHLFSWQKDEQQIDSEAKVKVIGRKLPEATEDDEKDWSQASFQISVNSEIFEADSDDTFSLGSTTDIGNMLHGEDLILELEEFNDFGKVEEFTRNDFLRLVMSVGITLFFTLILLICFMTLKHSFHAKQQDRPSLKQEIYNINENLRKVVVDVSRLTEIMDNHKAALSTVMDELKILQETPQVFEKKTWKSNSRVELGAEDKELRGPGKFFMILAGIAKWLHDALV